MSQEELIASNEIVRDGGRSRKDDFGYGKDEHGGLPCEQEQTEQSQCPERADPCSFGSPHGQRAGHQFEVDTAAAAIRHDGSSAAFPRFESYRRINEPRPEERAPHPEARVPHLGRAPRRIARVSKVGPKRNRASGHPSRRSARKA